MISLSSAWRYKQLTESSFKDLLKAFFAMLRGDDLTISQSIMSANSPAIIQKAMVEGFPNEGAMPSGQVAGIINNIPTCSELIMQIMREFELSYTRFKEIGEAES